MIRSSVLLLIVLLWSAAADATGRLKVCQNAQNYACDVENNADCCGPTISANVPGGQVEEDSFDMQLSIDLGADVYSCAYDPNGSIPTRDQVIAGSSPCLISRDRTGLAGGTHEFSDANGKRFTGATDDTTYRIKTCVVDSTGRPIYHCIKTQPFMTLAGTPAGGGSGSGEDLTNKGFFVTKHADCSDNNNGRALRTSGGDGPWCTISKVNSTVTDAGSNVYFEEGYTWLVNDEGNLEIDWHGLSDDRVEVRCADWNGTNAEGCAVAERYTFKGGLDRQKAIAAQPTENHKTYGAGCDGSRYNGAIEIHRDRVTAAGFHIEDSECFTLFINGVTNQSASALQDRKVQEIIIENASTEYSGWSWQQNNVINMSVTNVDLFYYNLSEYQVNNDDHLSVIEKDQLNDDFSELGGVPGGIATGLSENVLIQQSSAIAGWGEGMNCLKSRYMIFLDNYVSRIASASYYRDACEYDITDGNIFVQGHDERGESLQNCGGLCPGRGKGSPTTAIERVAASVNIDNNNLTRNNIFIGSANMIQIGFAGDLERPDLNLQMTGKWFGNTFIDPHSQFVSDNSNGSQQGQLDFEVKGNIFDDAGRGTTAGNANSSFDADYNRWPTGYGGRDPELIGPNDVTTALSFARSLDKFDNGLPGQGAIPTKADVELSTQIDGHNASVTTQCFDVAALFSDWLWNQIDFSDWSETPTKAQFGLCNRYDIDRDVRSSTDNSAGAQQCKTPCVP